MTESRSREDQIDQRLKATEERFRIAQVAGGIGWVEGGLETDEGEGAPHVAVLFGFDPQTARPQLADWQAAIFIDDVPKLRSAVDVAGEKGPYYVEFRVTHPDGSVHWIAGKGEVTVETGRVRRVAGVYYEISERKALEARLLALNETLEARIAELRKEARRLEVLNRTGAALAAELSLERLVQTVTDAAVELTRAQFGAFFYNVIGENGEAYT